ncbi:peptidase M24, structural domain-containing protein [Diplogelasinospora grovesii]|uniref:Xaa-Pro aminopeptidase n=1 Tax=Diplogelasinospora grovesii TaxID=303347 RepID=A0AAN6N3W3_9PEZI|nr:peptidase M24, structural domain-containing protein [Diplogelasinospora grovesii]
MHAKPTTPPNTHITGVGGVGVRPVTSGLIFLPGQDEHAYEDSDMGPAFRQRRYFYYLSGVNIPGCAVTYDLRSDQLILWIPCTDPRTVLWYGRTPTLGEVKEKVDVDDVRYIKGLAKYLYVAVAGSGQTLYVLHEDQAPRFENGRVKGTITIDTSKLKPAMDAARVVKSNYEVSMIRRANAVSSAAHKAVLSRLKKLTNEREIEAIFMASCLAQGASRQAYPVIAGSGPNASTLHYDANNESLAGRQLVCLDAGAEWNCYASDITRTFPISGKFSREAKQIYKIVQQMQEECIHMIKPGVVYYTLHLHACRVATKELLKLGILQDGSVEEMMQKGTVAAFFPHGLGHHVGLEVHDVSGKERLILDYNVGQGSRGANKGGNVKKREFIGSAHLASLYREHMALATAGAAVEPPPYHGRQKLERNMVVTVEPGLYFCKEYLQAFFLDNPLHAPHINKGTLARYWDVGGVRIEDCILVTDAGYENLTTAPKGEEEMLRFININNNGHH